MADATMSPAEVRRIAELARLRLSDAEAAKIAVQFRAILAHLEGLRAVPTEGVEPLDHPLPLADVLRDDVVRPGIARADALTGAPDAASGQFRVPRVMPE